MKRLRPAFAAAFILLAVIAGCSRPASHQNEDYIPAEDTSRAALEAYLQAWLKGNTAQAVPGTKPVVMASDNLHAQGRLLTGYKILGPVPTDANRTYAVQLSLGNPAAEVRERYVIVGIDPLWVWRYDDYLMLSHWSHPMPDPKAAPQKP